MNKLDQLRQYTVVVADSGDFKTIAQYRPQDATTNPSLLLKAAQMPRYQHLVKEAIRAATQRGVGAGQQLDCAIEKLLVNFGVEILKIIPGRVSSEVDASLSFDTEATIAAAKRLIELYQQQGVSKERVLIKIAATWEGIKAASELEKCGIQCNLTLIFCLEQAILCADSGVTLISPFVGRIYDWFVRKYSRDYVGSEDPGVNSVKSIYDYYKSNRYKTVVMGASFRHIGQIEALAGCDYLTLSPELMQKLQQEHGTLQRQLSPTSSKITPRVTLEEKSYRLRMNQNAMAHEKLAEGIRLFIRDLTALKDYCQRLLVDE